MKTFRSKGYRYSSRMSSTGTAQQSTKATILARVVDFLVWLHRVRQSAHGRAVGGSKEVFFLAEGHAPSSRPQRQSDGPYGVCLVGQCHILIHCAAASGQIQSGTSKHSEQLDLVQTCARARCPPPRHKRGLVVHNEVLLLPILHLLRLRILEARADGRFCRQSL